MIAERNLSCAVNAACGREMDNSLCSAAVSKRILIIGGGPGGMEAARVSSLRGHRVTLLERQRCLGGSLRLAATVHADNEPFLNWLITQVNQSAVEVRLGTEATPALIRSLNPDAIIVATGAQVEIADIEGAGLPHVYTGAQMRRIVEGRAGSADFASLPTVLRPIASSLAPIVSPRLTPQQLRQYSRHWMPLGKHVVVIGADLAAIELAEFLARRDRKVSVLEAGKRIAVEVGPKRRTEHALRLDKLGVTICTEARCEKIDAQHVHFRSASGKARKIAADSVIIAGEPVAATGLFDAVKTLATEVHAIGDCTGLGLIRKATDEAMKIARLL
jgi:2,4-dienoyl-CoA reductase (NADPH2)